MAISLVIPVSVKVTQLIETTFEETITQTYDSADEITNKAEESAEDEKSNAFAEFLKGIGDGAFENCKSSVKIYPPEDTKMNKSSKNVQ